MKSAGRTVGVLLTAVLLFALSSTVAGAQSSAQGGTQQPAPPEAGPQATEPIAIPKKTEPPPEPPKPRPKPDSTPEYTMRVQVPVVNVDVMVTTKEGQFIPGLKKENFRVMEDGVSQQVTGFSQSEAPITAVLLVEFAATNYQFMYDSLRSAYTFADTLKPQDWVAVISFDMKPHILQDFTQDKRSIYGALNQLRIPTFSETNVFDALYDTLDRIDGIEGRKDIILISTGRDTFSRITLDTAMKKIQATKDVTIFPVGIGRALLEWLDARGYMGSVTRLDFLQAENQMNTFARMTGGRAYFPRFEGELRDIFQDIGNAIRNQYTLAYQPTNSKQDGTYRKIKVELVDPAGRPLRIQNQKGKEVKYQVLARDGYKARMTVE